MIELGYSEKYYLHDNQVTVEYDEALNKVFLVGKEFEVELPLRLVNGNPTVTIYEYSPHNELGYTLVTFVEDEVLWNLNCAI